MKFRIRFVDQIVGFFVLVAIIGIAVILIFIGINQRWFAKDYYFTSNFSSGEGIGVGMSIMLQGFEIGKIVRISLTTDNRADIEFSVQDTYYDKVLPYSLLELVSSPIGLGNSLRFHPGKGGVFPLPDHSFIPSLNSAKGQEYLDKGLVELPVGEDVIGSVIEKVNPILDDLRATLTQVKRLVSDVDVAFTGKGGPIGGMVNQLAEVPSRLNQTIDKVNGTVDIVNTRVDAIAGNLNAIIERLNGTVDIVNTRVDGIAGSVNGVTDRVGTILDKIDTVSENLKDISENLKATSAGLSDTKGLATRLLDPQGSISTILNDSDALYNQIDGALTNVNRIITQVGSFVDYINGSRPQISNLLEKGSSTLDQGNAVLEGIKNNPLIKGGVPEAKTQGSTGSTYRGGGF
jgi:phospholipid/cholesterol/gamma-HCH transport system substrate-binding protein